MPPALLLYTGWLCTGRTFLLSESRWILGYSDRDPSSPLRVTRATLEMRRASIQSPETDAKVLVAQSLGLDRDKLVSMPYDGIAVVSTRPGIWVSGLVQLTPGMCCSLLYMGARVHHRGTLHCRLSDCVYFLTGGADFPGCMYSMLAQDHRALQALRIGSKLSIRCSHQTLARRRQQLPLY